MRRSSTLLVGGFLLFLAGIAAVSHAVADQAKRIATAKATLGKGDKDKFVAEMNASRDAAKKQMHAALDRAYDKLKAIGDKHPEARPAIAQAAAEAQGLLNGAVKGITDTVATVISTIGEGLEDAGKAIVGVVSKVGEGIKSIFSGW